jgi:hypothetical protein
MKNDAKKRYTLTMEFCVYAKNDNKAMKLASRIEAVQNHKFDNHATITQIHSNPFGSLNIRKIK